MCLGMTCQYCGAVNKPPTSVPLTPLEVNQTTLVKHPVNPPPTGFSDHSNDSGFDDCCISGLNNNDPSFMLSARIAQSTNFQKPFPSTTTGTYTVPFHKFSSPPVERRVPSARNRRRFDSEGDSIDLDGFPAEETLMAFNPTRLSSSSSAGTTSQTSSTSSAAVTKFEWPQMELPESFYFAPIHKSKTLSPSNTRPVYQSTPVHTSRSHPHCDSIYSRSHQISNPVNGALLSVIEERILMYQFGLQKADANGESSKIRRYQRQIKTLEDQRKTVQSGRPLKEEDIPPALMAKVPNRESTAPPVASHQSGMSEHSQGEQAEPATNMPPPLPPRPTPAKSAIETASNSVSTAPSEPAPPSAVINSSQISPQQQQKLIEHLKERQRQYKIAAVHAKKAGDRDVAIKYCMYIKQFEPVIEAAMNNNPVDLSNMPPVPEKYYNPATTNDSEQPPQPKSSPQPSSASQIDPSTQDPLQALIVRMQVYQNLASDAAKQGNETKCRRMGRMQKQYEDAIKALRNGKPVMWDDLLNPPGFPPLPNTSAPPPDNSIAGILDQAAAAIADSVSPTPKPPPPKEMSPVKQQPSPSANPAKAKPTSQRPASKSEQARDFLAKRQQQYRTAAALAMKAGDQADARRLLMLSKGFQPMIDACNEGKPVDLSKIPPALDLNKMRQMAHPDPSFESSEDIPPLTKKKESKSRNASSLPIKKKEVKSRNASPMPTKKPVELSEEMSDIYHKVELRLTQQADLCRINSDYYASVGEIAAASKCDQLLHQTELDREIIRAHKLRGELPPRMHYETRNFSKIKMNTDLSDVECEIRILRAINLPCPDGLRPDEVSSFVKWDFPWPTDAHPTGQTSVVKHTLTPLYNYKENVVISDKRARLASLFKRKCLELTVCYQKGLFKSTKVLGTCSLRLEDLDKSCEIHNALNIMEGRKPSGGKLEVSVRIRQPLVSREVENTVERWLVVESEGATRPLLDVPPIKPATVANTAVSSSKRSPRRARAK